MRGARSVALDMVIRADNHRSMTENRGKIAIKLLENRILAAPRREREIGLITVN